MRCEIASPGLGQDIVDGALNMVRIWRSSPPHYKYPVAMTAEVFALIDKPVKHPQHCNDYEGLWHDVLWMSRMNIIRRIDATQHLFKVTITGTGRKRLHTLKIVCGPGDDAEPVLTVMMPDQD